MKKNKNWAGILFTNLALVLAMAACGGGGGSEGDALHPAYTGETTQAVLDGSNAQVIVLGSYQGGQGESQVPPLSLTLVEELGNAFSQMDPGGQILYGACGGSASYSLEAQDSGSFNGSTSFTDYCAGILTLSGTVGFSGAVQGTANAFSANITFHFDDLTIRDADGKSFQADGELVFDLNQDFPTGTSGTTMTLKDLVITDGSTQKTYYYRDFKMQVSQGGPSSDEYEDIICTGYYYSHDDGFVKVATEQPLRTYWFEEHPSGGVLKFTGGNGTWAILTFTGGGNYRIDLSDGTVFRGNLSDSQGPSVRLAFLQYRTLEDRQYPSGWVDIYPSDPVSIQNVALRDRGGNFVPITATPWIADYLVYECRNGQCFVDEPYHDRGFSITGLPTDLAAGTYDLELTTTLGHTIFSTLDYVGPSRFPQ